MKKLYILITIVLSSVVLNAQNPTCTSVVSSNDGGNNGVRISKCLMSNYLSPTGTVIEYDINFSTQGSVGTIIIEDVLDSNFLFVSSTQPGFLGPPTPTGNTLKWTGTAPVGGYAYNIRLTVMFKPGETCNGTVASNQVSISGTNIPEVITDKVNVEAQAIDDWTITKTAVRASKVYLPGDTVEFEIVINGGGGIGRHNLTNINIQDVVAGGGATVTNFGCVNLNGSTISTYGLQCRIRVQYDASIWKDGDCSTNTITLTGTNPCGEIVTVSDTETICFDKDYVSPPLVGDANITKGVSIGNPVPNCSGMYTIDFKNTGTKDLTDLTLTDVFPAGINANTIVIDNYNNNSYEYSVNNGLNWIGPINASNYSVPVAPPYSGIMIRPVSGSSSIYANSLIRVSVRFTVDPGVSIGQVITNTALIKSPSESISKQASASFTIEEYQPKIRLNKSICNNNGSYEPGDELVYRVKVENIGSDAFVGGTLTDILDPRLQFMGINDVKVYKSNNGLTPQCSNNGILGNNVTDLTTSSTVNFDTSLNKLTIDIPTLNANCSLHESIWVEFRVKIKPGVQKGFIPNNININNGVINKTSNTVNISVIELYTLRVGKQISIDGGATYTSGPVTVPAGTSVKYKIDIENIGNSSIQNISLIDILPNLGDENISLNTPRGSTIGGILLNPVTVPSGFQTYYSTNSCPDTTPELGSVTCSSGTAANWTTVFNNNAKALKITSNTYILNPLSLISFIIEVEVPPNATTGDFMCNSANAIGKQLNGINTQVFSSETVCLETTAFEKVTCCKSDLNFEIKQGYDAFTQDYTRLNNIVEISGAPTFPLIPISEIKITMSDIDITYDYADCAKCIDDPKLWGSMEGKTNYLGTGVTDGQLFLEPNIGSGAIPQKDEAFRELIWSKWSGSAGRIIQSGDALEFNTYLPPKSKIPCCATSIKICYIVSWKDANCNVCETPICRTINLESLPKEQFKITSVKEDCCNVNLSIPNSNEYDRFLWSTGGTSSSITVNSNGVYTVDAWKNSVKYTSNFTVNNILAGNFPKLSFDPQAKPDQGDNFVIRDYTKARNTNFSYNANKYTLWIFSRWDSDKDNNGAFRKITAVANCETGFKNGDIQWDGRDNSGNKVQSGEYNFVLRLENCTKKCLSESGTCNETFSYESFVCKEGWVPLFPPLPRPRVWSICKEREWAIRTQRIGVVDLEW